MSEQAKCDFCSELEPRWSYPATDFVALQIGAILSTSEGSWAACDTCHDLIDSGDRSGLADRSAGLWVVANPDSAEVMECLRGELRCIHDLFFTHRTGKAQPITAEVRG